MQRLEEWLASTLTAAAVCGRSGAAIETCATKAEGCAVALPEQLRHAVTKRRRDFFAGRYCARQAMAKLGLPLADVGVNADRSPCWPHFAVGSITHTEGLVLAAAARKSDLRGIGIDAEVVMPLLQAKAVASQIIVAGELQALVGGVPELSFEELVTLVFSAKEAVYKCLYPSVGRYFGFEAVCVESVDARRGRFEVRLTESLGIQLPSGMRLGGFFCFVSPWVVSCVSLPHASQDGTHALRITPSP